MVDLEGLSGDDSAGLTAFAAELRAAVGPDVRLDVALQASTTAEGYAELGYDVPALAASLDHLTLMAYDQHGPWEPDDPGPVGSLDWTIDSLAALTALAPTDQVVLGVAGYGYRWGGDEPAGQVSDEEARDRVGAGGCTWEGRGEQTATLADGAVVWWSDSRSLDARVELARGWASPASPSGRSTSATRSSSTRTEARPPRPAQRTRRRAGGPARAPAATVARMQHSTPATDSSADSTSDVRTPTAPERAWTEHVIWWHVYPLGFRRAPTPTGADRSPQPRLLDLVPWLDHAARARRQRAGARARLRVGDARLRHDRLLPRRPAPRHRRRPRPR